MNIISNNSINLNDSNIQEKRKLVDTMNNLKIEKRKSNLNSIVTTDITDNIKNEESNNNSITKKKRQYNKKINENLDKEEIERIKLEKQKKLLLKKRKDNM